MYEFVLVVLFIMAIYIVMGVLFFGALLGIPAVLFAGFQIYRLSQRRRMLKQATHYIAEVSDIRGVRIVQPGQPLYYQELALRYAGKNGILYRAFFAFKTVAPLPFSLGMQVPVRVMPQTMIQVSPAAWDPARGADGRLSGAVREVKWHGIPMDETGNVMLEADHALMMKKCRKQLIGYWIMLIVFLLLFVIACFSLLTW